eukprot:s3434_g1.t1
MAYAGNDTCSFCLYCFRSLSTGPLASKSLSAFHRSEAVVVMALIGAALGATALFSYNRENFKFDKQQTLLRETLRLDMQLKRFALFRDDVRDLVTLTVDRALHALTAGLGRIRWPGNIFDADNVNITTVTSVINCSLVWLSSEFPAIVIGKEQGIIVFCKGRIQASAPPFVLQLFQLSNACAFMYLLLAVWLSMHASIASHSFGVKMLTRFVRLPIPTQKQLTLLQAKLIDFEKQGDWEAVRGGEGVTGPPTVAMDAGTASASTGSHGVNGTGTAQASALRAACAADAGATSTMLLDAKESWSEDVLEDACSC